MVRPASVNGAIDPLPAGRLIRYLFYAVLLTFLPFMRGHFFSVDEIEVYHQTRSWWEQGNFATAPLQNTVPGRGGAYYAPYGIGQSFLALPLYGAGKWIDKYAPFLAARLRGPIVGDNKAARWGGEVEIFFVLLLSCATVAAIVALFAALQMSLGVSPRAALGSAVLVGFASYPAGLSNSFFQHGLETFFLLWCFFFLIRQRQFGSRFSLHGAGFCAAALLLVRLQAVVALPALLLYLLLQQRSDGLALARFSHLRSVARNVFPFLSYPIVGLLLVCFVNYAKFATFSLGGAYVKLVGFDTPLLLGLYGNLMSASRSIFIFSPLLFLAPWYFPRFWKLWQPEALTILFVSACYIGLYSKVGLWHGMWCFGPRYLAAIIPLLLIPIGMWLTVCSRMARLILMGLAWAGMGVAVLHLAVNVSYVYYFEQWAQYQPEFGYLFIPQHSQLAAHWRALLAWDHRVDLWLIHYSKQFGTTEAVATVLLMVGSAAWAWQRTAHELRRTERIWLNPAKPVFADFLSWPLRSVILVWLLTIVTVSMRNCWR